MTHLEWAEDRQYEWKERETGIYVDLYKTELHIQIKEKEEEETEKKFKCQAKKKVMLM